MVPRPSADDACRDDELSELAWSIRRLWHEITHDLDQRGVFAGLHPQQFWILGVLREGPRRMSDLAALTNTSSANVTGLVDRLAERGLIERVRSEEDRRVVDVAVTEKGRAEVGRFKAEFCSAVTRVLSPLDDEEQSTLATLLEKVVGPATRSRRHT